MSCLPVFIGITLVLFLLLNLMAGSALDLSETQTTADRAAMAEYFQMDAPLSIRYFNWIRGVLCLDFGISFRTGTPVGEQILQRFSASLLLTGVGMLFSATLALLLGISSAMRPGGLTDRFSGIFSIAGAATPGFFLCLLLIYVFSIKLRVLPAISDTTLRGLLLPLTVIVLSNTGGLLKQVRGACLEVLGEPYIQTARAKGTGEAQMVRNHVLRNASLTLMTAILGHLPHIVGGSMIVERIFGWAGMGELLFSAIAGRDYPVVLGVTTVVACSVFITNLLLDILYGVLDPRVRYERR